MLPARTGAGLDLVSAPPLLEVRSLVKHFPIRRGLWGREVGRVHAVDGVSFDIRPAETFGLVGESGSGKTTTGRCVLRLMEPTSGEVRFGGKDVLTLDRRSLRRLRREMQIIFQDPYDSLNPRMRVGTIVEEPLVIHRLGSRRERADRTAELLRLVGLDPAATSRYPHEFSGGQRQRIGIARALALNPRLVVADEPVSSLDVSIQAQIVNLLVELQERLGLAYLFIAHDLRIVEHISDRVAVMYLGKIVELASSGEIYRHPLHPYTQVLLASIPEPDPDVRKEKVVLEGEPPSPAAPPPGCRFHGRCPVAFEKCRIEEPPLVEVARDHWAACHLVLPAEALAEAGPARA